MTTTTVAPEAPPRLDGEELRRFEHAILAIVRGSLNAPHQFASGLDKAGYVALVTLVRLGRIRQTELAEHLNLDRSTVCRQVRNLETRGFIRRAADQADGRAHVLVVTAAGREELAKQRQVRWAPVADRLALVEPEDRGGFLRFLEQLAARSTADERAGHTTEPAAR